MNLFTELHRIILLDDATEKCTATHEVCLSFDQYELEHTSTPLSIASPGYPEKLELVPPRKLKRRSMQSQAGRNTLLHAVAHIEYNAINLALDAAYRFQGQSRDYYLDWIKIADDEARHFQLIRAYLNDNDCDYGDYAAHNGLWEMAVKTQDDVVARMALVPRVLEARGLDVTPGMIAKLEAVNDTAAVEILKVIYNDEIEHVYIGSKWFFHQCSLRELEPRDTFFEMVGLHMHGDLRGPFNTAARLQAGFDEIELARLEQHAN